MSVEVWFSFVAASLALCFTPGPAVLLVVSQSLLNGKKAVMPMVFGIACGDLIALSFSLLGIGAVLSTSATAFNVMKYIGALYLVYLGVRALWQSQHTTSDERTQVTYSGFKLFRDSVLVTALNPKGLIFFMAFFPLFINPEKSIVEQMLILGSTFLSVSLLSASTYAIGAHKVRSIALSERAQRLFNRLSGGMLIGAGGITATLEQ
ncbi:lysine transporter LysE [Pseudoalteromonas luteoviolacea]|uniref:Lysine transporter LysE n=1 Tax=Pseudoalteromonas luteoviolacea TaxID=43657 RepID=A0A1C0TLT9_9GAMM|nr:LysE family translocator [Pseudoalteromonas luteoviolacea]OCQ19848.1 lysine transporter LysE [Pseudoalteromonas luteoviolacea]